MGGAVPLGYRVENRALHVDEDEAEFVRSLSDFAKLVELFDAQGVSFILVTQTNDRTGCAEASAAALRRVCSGIVRLSRGSRLPRHGDRPKRTLRTFVATGSKIAPSTLSKRRPSSFPLSPLYRSRQRGAPQDGPRRRTPSLAGSDEQDRPKRRRSASAPASPSRGPGNGILRAETGGRIQARTAGERSEFGSQTATRLANRPKIRGLLPTRKPRRFARTGWWRTQSSRTVCGGRSFLIMPTRLQLMFFWGVQHGE